MTDWVKGGALSAMRILQVHQLTYESPTVAAVTTIL